MAGEAAEVIHAEDQFPGDKEKTGSGGGSRFYMAERARFHIADRGETSAVVPFQIRLAKGISETGKQRAGDSEARVLIVVVGEDGYEHRMLQPLTEFEFPVEVSKTTGDYWVLGMIVSGSASSFAKSELLRQDVESGAYLIDLVEAVEDEESAPSFLQVDVEDLGTLKGSTPIRPIQVTLTDEHFIPEGESTFDQWAQIWTIWEPTNRIKLWGHRATMPFRLFAAAVWQVLSGIALIGYGIIWNFILASRDYDWGAIRSLDNSRKRQAAKNCVMYSRTRTTSEGKPELWADTYTVWGAPAKWWPMGLISYFILPLFGITANWISFTLVTAGLIFLQGLLLLPVPNNNGEVRPVWQHLGSGFFAFLRDLRISRFFDVLVFWKKPADPDKTMIDILSMGVDRDDEDEVRRAKDEGEKDFVEGKIMRALPIGTVIKLKINEWLRYFFQPVQQKPAPVAED